MKTIKLILLGVSLLMGVPALAALGDYSANSQEERVSAGKDDSASIGMNIKDCPFCVTPVKETNAHEATKEEVASNYNRTINGKEAKDTAPANAVKEGGG